MKTLAEQMSVYAAYHRHPANKALHFVGVPAITLSLLLALSWLRLPIGDFALTGALLFVVAVLGYYIRLDWPLAFGMAVLIAPLVYLADVVARWPLRSGLMTFAALFVGGWIIQLAGHVIEGRRPALVDNAFQVFVAPIFLLAEALFLLGRRRPLYDEVERRLTAGSPAP